MLRDLEKMKLDEPGMQKLGRHSSPVSRHSIQSYILTYGRLRKREPLIALGSHQKGGGFFNFCGVGTDFEHPCLAKHP